MVAYADLILPDTTYLERHDCLSLLDRPISEPDAAHDAIRWPVVAPDRDVRPFQSVMLDLGARLGLPGMAEPDGTPAYADYADYLTRHQRRPGVGPLAGWRGDGAAQGRGAPNPDQLARYIDNGAFWQAHVPAEAAFFKPWNGAYQDWAVATGLNDTPQPFLFQLYAEPLGRFQAAALGIGPLQPPDHLRDRLARSMAPLPVWYPPLAEDGFDAAAFPLHAITQRPAAMYHSWGSQNAWLRQIHGQNPLYVPGAVWEAMGFEDGDWADVVSPHARITVPVARMDAQNPHTVWTWNAIGKRPGAWALDPDAPEATRGFLLNHLIPERLPPTRRATPPRTPTRSPDRPRGTTSASAWSAFPPAPAAPPPSRPRPPQSAAAPPLPRSSPPRSLHMSGPALSRERLTCSSRDKSRNPTRKTTLTRSQPPTLTREPTGG